jgi:hypothetical protein
VKQRVMEYENRLRYANDVIQNLESENQQVEIDVAQARGAIESQNRAYNELKNNFYLMNSNSDSNGLGGSMSSPMISIPKVVIPAAYYKPNPMPTRASINLMPVVSKAISQQVGPSNIKSYLSNIKKTTINLMENLAPPSSKGIHNSNARESKVTFSPN